MIIDSKQKWPLKLRSVASTLNGRAHLCVDAEKKTHFAKKNDFKLEPLAP